MSRHYISGHRHYHRITRYTFRTYTDVIHRRGNRFVLQPRYPLLSLTDGRRATVEKQETSPPETSDLTIKDIDFNIKSNTKAHRTNDYDISEKERDLVIRRGQTFDITIEFNKAYNEEKDDLKLVFLAGDNPKPPKGTHVSLILSDKDEKNEWGAWISSNKGNTLSITINTPPTCFVGKWKFQVEIVKKSDTKKIVFEYNHDQEIYILFNPWCKDDQVYQPDTKLLEEYILNETGKIYTGTKREIYGKPWNFGQFEKDILDCAMYLLDNNKLSWAARGDPVKLTRKLSALTNSQDDNGILVGNWSGTYNDGTPPTRWSGSIAILQQYFRTKNPVSYGQCWVFSGVLTTLHRTLGIPARSVTNFQSAHDCDGSVTIDTYWSESGEPLEELNDDSTWNFHVWNDVWMARPDLPPGYGGWQAVDATPQETSDGIYCCGPSSLEAIKRGELQRLYDTPFVFAEVNADRVHWQLDDAAEINMVRLDKKCVGFGISTKRPKGEDRTEIDRICYDTQREDITSQYKYPEGSEEERTAVIKANQFSSMQHVQGIYNEEQKQDVDFELVDKETVPFGNDFVIILKINNRSDETRTVSGCISTSSMHYTGVPAEKIKSLPLNMEKIPPKSYKEIRLPVTFTEYHSLLVEQCHMKMSCMCKVMETNQSYVYQDAFRLIKPEITIKAPSTGKVGVKVTADVSFTNPLPCALTNCDLTVEGPGLQDAATIKQGIVEGKHTFTTTVEFLPRKAGKRDLVVLFNSNELSMVEGSCEITIS